MKLRAWLAILAFALVAGRVAADDASNATSGQKRSKSKSTYQSQEEAGQAGKSQGQTSNLDVTARLMAAFVARHPIYTDPADFGADLTDADRQRVGQEVACARMPEAKAFCRQAPLTQSQLEVLCAGYPGTPACSALTPAIALRAIGRCHIFTGGLRDMFPITVFISGGPAEPAMHTMSLAQLTNGFARRFGTSFSVMTQHNLPGGAPRMRGDDFPVHNAARCVAETAIYLRQAMLVLDKIAAQTAFKSMLEVDAGIEVALDKADSWIFEIQKEADKTVANINCTTPYFVPSDKMPGRFQCGNIAFDADTGKVSYDGLELRQDSIFGKSIIVALALDRKETKTATTGNRSDRKQESYSGTDRAEKVSK